MQCLYVNAYDFGNYHRSAEGCGSATKEMSIYSSMEMSIYSSIILDDPLRDMVVLKRTRAASPVCTS